MEIVILVGIFLIRAVVGAIVGARRISARRPIAEQADASSKTSGRVNDLLTVLGAPLFHAKDNRTLTTEERVEWIQARVG